MKIILFSILFGILACLSQTIGVDAKQCLPFISIQSLVFQQGHYTVPGRTSATKQLNCISGCYHSHLVESVMCQNIGSDGSMPNWVCTTNFPDNVNHLRLAQIDVSCEGCNYAGDSNILSGSCSLNYGLKSGQSDSTGFFNNLMIVIVYAVIIFGFCYVIYLVGTMSTHDTHHHVPSYYQSYPSYPSYPRYPTDNGFWSGYLLGNRYNSNRPNNYRSHTSSSTSYGSSSSR